MSSGIFNQTSGGGEILSNMGTPLYARFDHYPNDDILSQKPAPVDAGLQKFGANLMMTGTSGETFGGTIEAHAMLDKFQKAAAGNNIALENQQPNHQVADPYTNVINRDIESDMVRSHDNIFTAFPPTNIGNNANAAASKHILAQQNNPHQATTGSLAKLRT